MTRPIDMSSAQQRRVKATWWLQAVSTATATCLAALATAAMAATGVAATTMVFLVILAGGLWSPQAMAADQEFPAGSVIIDMGTNPGTVEASLKPYGLIYDLVINSQIPVYWAINTSKSKDGSDFNADGSNYQGGSFVIHAAYVAEANTTLATWQAKGVQVSTPTSATFTAPIEHTLTSFPNSVLDTQSGSIVADYYANAEVPSSSYRIDSPAGLTRCDDFYAMPHADPAWSTHENLLQFVADDAGYLWAACHAVSVLEGLVDPADPTRSTDFLSNGGLVDYKTPGHDNGTPPYSYTNSGDPVMQFMGIIDAATENGSEQIYLPQAGGWRPGTTISTWDPDHPDVPGISPGPAAKIAYGRAFGNTSYGMVMYEGGHSQNKGSVNDVAAQRAYLNFLLLTGVEKRPTLTVTDPVPADINEAEVVTLGAAASGGSGLFTYEWRSSCGGTFSDPNGANTSFTAPETDVDLDCILRVIVQDTCGRLTFAASTSTIHPVFLADLVLTKSDAADPVGTDSTISYTLTVTNNGPDTASNVVLTDDVAASGTSFVSASGTGWTCSSAPVQVTCSNPGIAAGTSASVDLVVTAPATPGVVSNTASVTSDAVDSDITSNSATETTTVQPDVDLAVAITDAADPINADRPLEYNISVSNLGPEDSTTIVLSNPLPDGTRFSSAQGIGWNCAFDSNTNTVNCTLNEGLASGTNANDITLVIERDEGGVVVNTATVTTTDSLDSNNTNNSATESTLVTAVANLKITKLVNDASIVEGPVRFKLILENNGPSVATGISIRDAVPLGVKVGTLVVQDGFINVSSPDNGKLTPNGDPIAVTVTPSTNVVIWDIPSLNSGDTIELFIDAEKVGSAIIENTATIATANELDLDPFDNLDQAKVGVAEADLAVTKIATLDATAANPVAVTEVERNQAFGYVISVANNGPEDLELRKGNTTNTDINVLDVLPAEMVFVDTIGTDARWNCTSSGSPVEVSCSYQPTGGQTLAGNGETLAPIVINVLAAAAAGDYDNLVDANYANREFFPKVDNNRSNDSFVLTTSVKDPVADVVLSKAVDQPNPSLGDTVTFTVAINNLAGPEDASGVQITDALPAGLTLQSVAASAGSYTGDIWALGDLLVGATETLVITAVVTDPGRITNVAEITALDQTDPNPDGPRSATVDVPDADLAISKVVSQAPVAPASGPLTVGQQVEFLITLSNNGSVDGQGLQNATNLVITDALPPGLTMIDPATDISTSTGSASYDGSNANISWSLASLATGASATMTVRARVDNTNALTNNASITAADQHDVNTVNNTATAQVDVVEASLGVTKVMVDERVVNPGDIVDFVITLANAGPDGATGVTLVDQLPSGLTVVVPATDISTSSGSTTFDSGTNRITWNPATLASGSSITLNVRTRVDSTGTLTNSAAITSSDQSDSNPNDNADDAVVLSGGNSDLFLTKVIDDPSVTIGDTVTFTLDLINYGPDAATGIVVQDILPSGLTTVVGSPSVGTFDPATGIWQGFGLANNATAQLVITADTTSAGQFSNVGLIIGADQGDPDGSNDLANAVYEVFPAGTLINLSGQLYYDGNDDGLRNGSDAALGTAAVVKLISANDPTRAVEISQADPNTGAWSFSGLPAGEYSVLVDDNSLRSDITATAPAAWTFRTPSNGTLSVTLTDADVAGQDFGFLPDIQLSGEAGNLVINEVLTRKKNGNDQFIELFNAGTTTLDLSSWQLADGNPYVNDHDGADSLTGNADAPAYTFPAGSSLASGAYAVIWLGDSNADTQAPGAALQVHLATTENLDRDGDELWLLDSSAKLVDYIAWGAGSSLNTPPPASLGIWDATYQAGLTGADKGQSLSLTRDGNDSNSTACWEPTTSADAAGRCGSYLPTISEDDSFGRTSTAGANNNGVVIGVGANVSGRVYSDADHNSQYTDGEPGIFNSTVVLHDITNNTCTAVRTAVDGSYRFSDVPDGDYAVIAADSQPAPTPGSCPPAEDDASGHVSTTTNTRLVTVAGVDQSNQNFGDFNGSVLRGVVFVDNGAGGGIAYNGVVDGSEATSAGVTVVASASGVALDSSVTDGSGSFTLWLPAGSGTVTITSATPPGMRSVSQDAGNTGATLDADKDTLRFDPLAGTSYSNITFGDAGEPAFSPDHERTALAGSIAFYPHTFTADTRGEVSFAVINATATPDLNGWATVLYADSNCDAQLDSDEPAIDGPLPVAAGVASAICVIAKVLVPAAAPRNAQYRIDVQATMAYSGAGVPDRIRLRSDLTTVGEPSEAGLEMVKEVDKNGALPGETLSYTITYRNTSREPLANIVVNDSTPVFTNFQGADCAAPLPAGITGCTLTEQPALNAKGAIKWTLDGALEPGSEGQVRYQVRVDG